MGDRGGVVASLTGWWPVDGGNGRWMMVSQNTQVQGGETMGAMVVVMSLSAPGGFTLVWLGPETRCGSV